MIIEKNNTIYGEQIVLKAEEGFVLVNDDTRTSVVYLGKNMSIEDWHEEAQESESIEAIC